MNYLEACRYFGITTNITTKDLQKRYRQLLKTHHPDNGGNEEVASKINSAYELLKEHQQNGLIVAPPIINTGQTRARNQLVNYEDIGKIEKARIHNYRIMYKYTVYYSDDTVATMEGILNKAQGKGKRCSKINLVKPFKRVELFGITTSANLNIIDVPNIGLCNIEVAVVSV